MKIYKLFLPALFLFIVISCKKEPIATFTVNKRTAYIGESIQFTNLSEDAHTYSWDFGDGNISEEENPVHTFQNAGTFQVSLTAQGDGGTNTYIQTITIKHPEPVASFLMSASGGSTGEAIQFTNTSQHASSFNWNFGDGNTSTEENPTHAYSSDGTFTVKLTASGDGGENSSSKTIEITNPPLTGKWNIESCKYNGSQITGVSGWINIKDETSYSARFDYGDEYGSASATYSIKNETEIETNIPSSIILFGSSFGLSSWSTKIVCTGDNFLKFGATAILHTAVYGNVKFEIENGKLILRSPDSKTEIVYLKE